MKHSLLLPRTLTTFLLLHPALATRSPIKRDDQRIGELWLTEDVYQGSSFFDEWDFYTDADPTHGSVTFLNGSAAFQSGLAAVQPDGTVIMKADNTTWLPQGQFRNSVRITSKKLYNGGLFVLDTSRAPWGCGVWPAWWTVGTNWPHNGEIDIIEGVHDNTHNQATWHTAPGCLLTDTGNFTGTVINTTCDATVNNNAGCGVVDWSRVSYGPEFDALGGGMYTMKWDETGIAVWYFYRNAIPTDLVDLNPNPSGWGQPSAFLSPDRCDLSTYFANHSIVFDITLCGDWAGNSYSTSGCPGTCSDRLQDPSNFVNASWHINSLRVYSKKTILGATGPGVAIQSPNVYSLCLISVVLLLHVLI